MPVCSEMPWGGPFHGPHGCGRGRGMGRGAFGFGGCGRGAFGGWGARGMGPWGFGGHHDHRHGPYGHHRGHHHGPPPPPPPPHHGCGGPHEHFHGPPPPPPPPHHGCPPPPPPTHHGCGGPHDHHHGPPPPPHHGPPCGGPRGRFGGCRGGMGGGPMRGAWGRGGCGPCGRGRMGRPWMWGPAGTGPRHWRCRPGAFDAPFDDALLVTMLLNFDLPVFSRDGDTGEDVLPSAPEEEHQHNQDQAQNQDPAQEQQDQGENQEPAETNVIRIDTRRFRPEDIRVSFTDGQLRVTASRTEDSGEEVTLTRSAALRRGSKVTAKLAADGYLYIRAEDPPTAARNVSIEIAEEKQQE